MTTVAVSVPLPAAQPDSAGRFILHHSLARNYNPTLPYHPLGGKEEFMLVVGGGCGRVISGEGVYVSRGETPVVLASCLRGRMDTGKTGARSPSWPLH